MTDIIINLLTELLADQERSEVWIEKTSEKS